MPFPKGPSKFINSLKKLKELSQIPKRLGAFIGSFFLNASHDKTCSVIASKKNEPPSLAEDSDLGHLTIRKWLKENNYSDVLEMIDDIMLEWQIQGKRTRRNWWAILAGNNKGQPRKIAGREIPVLRAAQIREGCAITPNAMCRNEKEEIELKRETQRWSNSKVD